MEYYTVEQLAQEAGIPEVRVRWAVLTNKVNSIRIPNGVYNTRVIPVSDAEKFLTEIQREEVKKS